MAYHESMYFLVFLPVVLIGYQIAPKKMRWGILLTFSYIFYMLFCAAQIRFLLLATLVTYLVSYALFWMKQKHKAYCQEVTGEARKMRKAEAKKKEKAVLIIGILLLLFVLISLKYSGFLAENINLLFSKIHINRQLTVKKHFLPLGISFYTLSAIGYMVDVYWEKITPEKNIGKLALFLSFFPIIMEGPICVYEDTAADLTAGNDLRAENLVRGYLRIGFGLVKKVVIADRLYVWVSAMFDNYTQYHGAMIAVAAVSYTIQLYMEFSGCMDIVIGSGELFGVHLPENFAQPFVSQNASEFWRRWHISLGRWFKLYIFYPVSMSKLTKKWNKFAKNHVGTYGKQIVASLMALFPVWLCNGLWHGPRWSYIFYGMYYFVIIALELMLEPVMKKIREKCSIPEDASWWKVLRIAKTWLIIFTGELFFRADTFTIGFSMFRSLFHGFSLSCLWDGTLLTLGLAKMELLIVVASLLVVGIVHHFRERKVDVRGVIMNFRLPVRWAFYFALIFTVVLLGAYGPGFQEVDFIYAGF